ncbi:sensor histidine kinase [Clostridium sp.]|uniref:sensor histidine kinase n=1 Tax=Clostridium sp. TaxID=1506 RepID=UPI003D6D39D2
MENKLNVNKTITTVIALNIIQIITIFGVILYNYLSGNFMNFEESFYIGELIICGLIIIGVINTFFVVKDINSLNKHNNEYSMLKDTLGQLEDLYKTLRGQRHDFMNHLQVVYSLMEMNENSEATEYIENVFKDIQKINKVLKTSNPAVNALLQAKILYGEKRGIKTEISITSALEGLSVPAWEFCRVLGNIIDNAVYALGEKSENRIIKIELFENLKTYGFRIENNGPRISEGLINRVFDTGVTTKGEHGEGMGLSIVKDILQKYDGDIDIFSNNEATIFEGWIPR